MTVFQQLSTADTVTDCIDAESHTVWYLIWAVCLILMASSLAGTGKGRRRSRDQARVRIARHRHRLPTHHDVVGADTGAKSSDG